MRLARIASLRPHPVCDLLHSIGVVVQLGDGLKSDFGLLDDAGRCLRWRGARRDRRALARPSAMV